MEHRGGLGEQYQRKRLQYKDGTWNHCPLGNDMIKIEMPEHPNLRSF